MSDWRDEANMTVAEGVETELEAVKLRYRQCALDLASAVAESVRMSLRLSVMELERNLARAERDALKAERDALKAERDALKAENATLAETAARLRAELDAIFDDGTAEGHFQRIAALIRLPISPAEAAAAERRKPPVIRGD